MKLDGLTVTLKDVRHIPGSDSNLVSEALLHDQGFTIHKNSRPLFHYSLEGPANQRFFAVRNSSDVYTLTADEPIEASPQAFVAMAAPTAVDSQSTSNEPIPTAGEQQLVAYLSSNMENHAVTKPPSRDEHFSKASIDIRSAFPKTLWE